MSSNEFVIDGKPLSSLRVVDLKEELEKRGLSKSGSKKDLYERLKTFLTTERQRQAVTDDEQLPNISIQQKLADDNPFLRDYFASQAELFHEQKRVQKLYHEEKKRESEASADEGGSSPTKSGGRSPMKSPSQSPSKRVSEQAPPPIMMLAYESPTKEQESPKKLTEVVIQVASTEPAQFNKSPQKPSEETLEKPAPQPEKAPSPTKIPPAIEPVPVQQDRSPRKSTRNREPEPPAEEPIKEAESPKKTASAGGKFFQKVAHLDKPPNEAAPEPGEVEEAKTVIKEPSPRRRSSREIVAKPDEAIQKDAKAADEGEGRVRTRRGSQQTRSTALLNNVNKSSHTEEVCNKVQENNVSEKVIPEEKPAEELKQEPQKKRGGREIIFDLKKEESKPLQKEQEESKESDEGEKPAETKRMPLRTRAERFKKEISPPPTSAVKQDENSIQKPVPTEQPRKMSTSSEEAPPTKTTHAATRPRRGGREIVFDIKKESKPSTPTPPAPPPAKRAVALLSTEELASDEVLDFGDDDKDRKEESQIEREPWIPRKINVKNKSQPRENPEEKGWTKKEVKDGEEILNINWATWQYLKQTYYQDLELFNDEDLRLDVHDASFDDGNFGRQFDDIQITRTISNDFGENGDGHVMEEPAEPVKASRKRLISEIIEDEEKEQLSPSRNPPSEVIKITNLVRPFTLTQLKELLQRTGNVVDLWVDKIKSKCVVKYEEEAQALETRAALHGVTWPASNTKYLRVDFSTTEELDELRNKELSDERPKVEDIKQEISTSAAVRAWDVGKDGRARRRSGSLSKDKELDRKRARRSSKSPHDERSSRRDRDHRSDANERDKKEPVKTGKALDELFRKTVATPCIYWLPLTPQQIAEKEELRRQRMLDRDRRISDLAKPRDQRRR